MSASLALLMFLVAADQPSSKFIQVAPTSREMTFARSENQGRAVVLIHGFRPHLFSEDNALRPEWQTWQRPGSGMVQALAKDADVYAFCYAMTATVERIATAAELVKGIEQVKQLGYRDLVLVGHSSGGLIARQFVEDHPDAGVTKVVQIGTPNIGTSWAKATFGGAKSQEVFLGSLTPEGRQKVLKERATKKVPDGVEFVCVVCRMSTEVTAKVGGGELVVNGSVNPSGDGVVSCDSQWSEDLRCQGIPAVTLCCFHPLAMRCKAGEAKVAEVVRDKHARWDQERVAAEKPTILNTK